MESRNSTEEFTANSPAGKNTLKDESIDRNCFLGSDPLSQQTFLALGQGAFPSLHK
jgi:hypothetical protein